MVELEIPVWKFSQTFSSATTLILFKLGNHILCYNSLCFYVRCVHVLAILCVWFVCIPSCKCKPMHTHVEARGRCWMSSSTYHSPYCRERHLSLNQKFTILLAQLSMELSESIFPCPSTGVTGTDNHAWISLYTELRSSYLHSKCSYLLTFSVPCYNSSQNTKTPSSEVKEGYKTDELCLILTSLSNFSCSSKMLVYIYLHINYILLILLLVGKKMTPWRTPLNFK